MVDVLKPVLKITALLRYNSYISVLGFSREIESMISVYKEIYFKQLIHTMSDWQVQNMHDGPIGCRRREVLML